MSKHDLRARPVFHHTHQSIQAHLTVVTTALAIARHLQTRTDRSIKKIVHAFRPVIDVPININEHELTALSQHKGQGSNILASPTLDPILKRQQPAHNAPNRSVAYTL